MQLSECYQPRPIRFLEIWSLGEFKLKVYGITYKQRPLSRQLVVAARKTASRRLIESASSTNHYGVGFVGIHQGRTGNFVFVDWWADENELHHHVYVSPSGKPVDLKYMTPSGLAACVWDLSLISHERNAWVINVLKNDGTPNLEKYMEIRANVDV